MPEADDTKIWRHFGVQAAGRAISFREMQMKPDRQGTPSARTVATRFVVLLGIVSLFADMTYEGARSITGPYLGSFGVSAATVAFVAGFGELIAYVIRLASGYLSDKTGRYWTITLIGYALNLFAVPLLALAGKWEIAAFLIIVERFGKGIRNPPRDAMLSHATRETGRGWGFGLHEALDQVGAVLGPLIVSLVMFFNGGFRTSFATLLIPALLATSILLVARRMYPSPRDMERTIEGSKGAPYSRVFLLYLAAVAFIAAGYADYPLIAYHFGQMPSISKEWIPVFYAVAMGVDALAALLFGRLYDRLGPGVMIGAVIVSAGFAPLVFFGGFYPALIGVALWGVGMGAHESVMRAAVAGMVAADRRGTAYGFFNTGYGIAWFAGSVLMGHLYDISVMSLVVFSVVAQMLAIPVLILVIRWWSAQGAGAAA